MNRRGTKLYKFLKKCETPPNNSFYWLTLNVLFNIILILLGKCLIKIWGIGNKHGSQYVLMSSTNMGDILFLYRSLDLLKKENGFSDIIIVADKMFLKPLQDLEISKIKIVPYWAIMALGKAVQLYPHKYRNIVMGQPWYFFGMKSINSHSILRSIPCKVSKETIHNLFPKAEMQGHSVILSPYEQTVSFYGLELLPLTFWSNLALRLKEKGFFVFTNCNGKTEKPIDGTVAFFPKMSELAGAVKYAGYCVSMRSGFTDWISSANLKREVVLYPTKSFFEYYNVKMLWDKGSALEYIYGESEKSHDELGAMIVDYFVNGDGTT
jgi:hypothetical protein